METIVTKIRNGRFYKQSILAPYAKEVLEKYKNGVLINDIAKEYKVSFKSVVILLKANNIEIKTNKDYINERFQKCKQEIINLYKLGNNCLEISKLLKFSTRKIRSFLRQELNIDLTPESSSSIYENKNIFDFRKNFLKGT
jgi:intein-encoded DNA endonuclease-like protein